jgi:NAD-dependent dihydropyrimidine dehydrogenase PreA subunit
VAEHVIGSSLYGATVEDMSIPLAPIWATVDNQAPAQPGSVQTLSVGRSSQVTYIIVEPCIDTKDASCVEVCPVDCIYEGDDQFYIHPDECIDCGACEPECPVQAIFPDTDVPPEWTNYIEKNRAHFD